MLNKSSSLKIDRRCKAAVTITIAPIKKKKTPKKTATPYPALAAVSSPRLKRAAEMGEETFYQHRYDDDIQAKGH